MARGTLTIVLRNAMEISKDEEQQVNNDEDEDDSKMR